MVIVYSNRAALGLSAPGRLGARLALLARGVGLVTLACLDPEERETTLRLAAESGDRWSVEARLMTDLPARLEEIRRAGHAFADDGYLDSKYCLLMWAVAVPILPRSGKITAAMSSTCFAECRETPATTLSHSTEVQRRSPGDRPGHGPATLRKLNLASAEHGSIFAGGLHGLAYSLRHARTMRSNTAMLDARSTIPHHVSRNRDVK